MVTTTAILVTAGALTLASYTAHRIHTQIRLERRLALVKEIMAVHDHLAEDMIEVDPGVRALWANQAMAEHTRAVLNALGPVGASVDFDDEEEEVEAEAPTRMTPTSQVPSADEVQRAVMKAGTVVLSQEVREVRNHYTLRSRNLYVAALVAETKNRFGTPERTSANRLAVRKFALDKMTAHGLRPTHIAQALPLVVELTFCQSDAEMDAAEYGRAAREAERAGGLVRWISRAIAGSKQTC